MGKDDIVNPKTKNIRLYVKRVFISDDFDGELVREKALLFLWEKFIAIQRSLLICLFSGIVSTLPEFYQRCC